MSRLVATGLMLLVLSGCVEQRYWDDYASKAEMMKFMSVISCGTWFPSSPQPHQIYFQIASMTPLEDGSYQVDYRDHSERTTERIYFLAAQYVGLQRYTAFYQVRPRPGMGAKCSVLVALPWSEYSGRPFRYPKAEPLLEQASQGRFLAAVVGLGVLIVLLRLAFHAAHGFLEEEHDAAAACAGSFMAVVVVNAVCWWVSGWGLSNIHKLMEFYAFYDVLPQVGPHLWPLTWAQASKVFEGPPHPSALTVDFRLFYVLLALSSVAWIGIWSEAISTGRRMRRLPAPVNELMSQAAAEGRVPASDEFMRAIMQAATTMNTRELEAFRRTLTKRIGHDKSTSE